MRKIINIALIFILASAFLLQDLVYSSDLSCLRAPLLFGDKKIIHARDIDINKPISSMSFEELVWWYKAFRLNETTIPLIRYSLDYAMKHEIILLDFKEQIAEVEKLLEQYPLKGPASDRKIMQDYFLWVMRISTKEIDIPLSMSPNRDAIRREIEDLIIKADKEQRLKPSNAGIIKKRCLVEIMIILEDFYEKEGRALFEKAYRERQSDTRWPDYAYEGGVATLSYLYPKDVVTAPYLLTKDQTLASGETISESPEGGDKGVMAYGGGVKIHRGSFSTQDLFKERKILITEIAMTAIDYKQKENRYPVVTDTVVFPAPIKERMEKLGVKAYRESDDCVWIYSEEDDCYMRLSKISTRPFVRGAQKDTEAEVLTRKGIEEVERVGAAIRVFKGHDLGGIFKIFRSIILAAQKVDSIGIRLDSNTEHFQDELHRMHSSLIEGSHDRIMAIVEEQAVFSKESTLTLDAADETISTLQEILDNLKKEKINLVNIHREFNKLYKGNDDLSNWFKGFFEYIDVAIEMLQSRIEIATGVKTSYSPQPIINIIKDICSQNSIIKVENNLPEDIKVNGNRLTLTNALMNIIGNAVWFAKEANKDKAEVKVVLSEEKGQIRIDIIDNGEGISRDILEVDPITGRRRLFSLNVSGRKGGTGLGTTDAWYAVTDHGGAIDVQSELGKGTTFTITLPVASVQGMEKILEQYKRDIEHLRDVKEKGLEVLSPEAREVLYNPDKSEWMKNFTPMVFYELYTFLKSPETRGLSFMREKPDLFKLGSLNEHEALGDFLRNIVKISIFKLSKEDKIAAIEASCRIKSETQKWLRERAGREDVSEFGQGDEHALTGNFGRPEIIGYIEKSGKAFPGEYELVGIGRYYVLRGQITKAVTQFKLALLTQIIKGHIVFLSGEEGEVKREDILELQRRGLWKDRIPMSSEDVNRRYNEVFSDKFNKEVISLIRRELLWMQENGIKGVQEIIEALGIRTLASTESIQLVRQEATIFMQKMSPVMANVRKMIQGLKPEEKLSGDTKAALETLDEEVIKAVHIAEKLRNSVDMRSDKYKMYMLLNHYVGNDFSGIVMIARNAIDHDRLTNENIKNMNKGLLAMETVIAGFLLLSDEGIERVLQNFGKAIYHYPIGMFSSKEEIRRLQESLNTLPYQTLSEKLQHIALPTDL